ncbi:hypothetical protein LTR75_003104 [Friedmanniomyces endolithicus]|nr:hypothetical protein LTR75_003104 [Friedmanniomyces endolithicus]
MSNNFSYYQQSAPFWDWVASLEDQGNNHPFFARGTHQSQAHGSDNGHQQPNPWANGWAGFPFGPMPHRGRHGSHGSHARHHPGPRHEHKAPPAPQADHDTSDGTTEKERDPEAGSSFGPMGGLGELAQMFQSQLFGDNTEPNNTKETDAKTEDFKPEVDVFDTTDSYVVHISLPGAKKEDVGVNWDAEKSGTQHCWCRLPTR